MQCPKCKSQISDKVLRCPHCNLKVRIVCPQCNTVSPMGKKFCAECGFKFFKTCPDCKTVNLYSSKKCRKCGKSFEEPKIEEIEISSLDEPTDNITHTIPQTPYDEEKTLITEEQDPNNKAEKADAENSNSNENDTDDEGYYVSSDEFVVSDAQLKEIIEKVEKIDKNEEKRAESEALIQKKFEQQEEIAQEKEEEIPSEYVQLNQTDAQNVIIEAVQNPIKRVISLSGKEGFGKSLILKYVFEALRKNENYICALGECNALTQITPFGYIQDVLLNLCNLSNFSINIEDFINNNTKALQAKFFNLNPQEINDLFNFLYPFKRCDFNGILKRKEYTINILKKVVENLAIKSFNS